MKNYRGGINPSLEDDPIRRRNWAITDEFLREITRALAGIVKPGNAPTVIIPGDENFDAQKYLYLPGRLGGQTLTSIDNGTAFEIEDSAGLERVRFTAPLASTSETYFYPSSGDGVLIWSVGATGTEGRIGINKGGSISASMDIDGENGSAPCLSLNPFSASSGQAILVSQGGSSVFQVTAAGLGIVASYSGQAASDLWLIRNLAGNDATILFAIQAKSSQTGNLTEWRNSSGTPLTTVRADGSVDFAAGSSNVRTAGANSKRTLLLTSAGGKGTLTAGCGGPTQVEAATNDNNYWALEYDTTTEESAFWNVQMPDNYDGSTITARFIWTNAGGAATETVRWGIKARAYADSDAIDQAFGTEVTVDDTWLSQNDVHISPASSAVTIGGTPAGGQWMVFNVARKTASDNLAGDARLLAVQIEYGINAYGD